MIVYRIIPDDSSQDWVQSLYCLAAVFADISSNWSSKVKEVFLQSDGVSNFSCTPFMLALPKMALDNGVRVIEHNITEAGGGKNKCDR